MRQSMLKLDRNYQRPVVILENGIMALLDTGALMPVWIDDEEILINEFKARLFKKKVSFIVLNSDTNEVLL